MTKGFTLIELLAVIVILSIIATITGVLVINTINTSENKISDIQKANIEEGAERFFVGEGLNSIDLDGEPYIACVNLNYLVDNGYFDAKEIKDPSGSETMEGSVVITYDANQYNYKYSSKNCIEEDFDYIWE